MLNILLVSGAGRLEFCRETWVLMATPGASWRWCAHSHGCNKLEGQPGQERIA